MKITEEQLKTLRGRVEQVFIAKTGHKPDCVEIEKDGQFYCQYSWSSHGDSECITEYIGIDELTSDLDSLYKERMEREEAARIVREQKAIADRARCEEVKKAERKRQYEKLKKEFENK